MNIHNFLSFFVALRLITTYPAPVFLFPRRRSNCRTTAGDNGIFLLNVPPDRHGRFAERDTACLLEGRRRIREIYGDHSLRAAPFLSGNGQIRRHRIDVRIIDSHCSNRQREEKEGSQHNFTGLHAAIPLPLTVLRSRPRYCLQNKT